MKEAIKATADWYFDGPGWILMCVLGVAMARVVDRNPRFWWPVIGLLMVIMPVALALVRHKL